MRYWVALVFCVFALEHANAAKPAAATEEISQGQNELALVSRARRACDVKAAHATATH
jgi:hypothetical protein